MNFTYVNYYPKAVKVKMTGQFIFCLENVFCSNI